MKYAEFESKLNQGRVEPLYFFYGEETYFVEQSIKRIIAAVLGESGDDFNLDILYGSEQTVERIMQAAMAFPVMADRRVVVVREVQKMDSRSLQALESYVARPADTSVVIFTSESPDFRKTFFKSLKSAAASVEFKKLYEKDIVLWIENITRSRKKSITPAACRLLSAYVNPALTDVATEVEKLSAFVGDRESIEEEDVEYVVGVSKEFNIFELTDAIGRKEINRALEITDHLMRGNESPVGMVVMLTRFFTQLWVMSDAHVARMPGPELARAIGVHPYFVKDYRVYTRSFNRSALENGLAHLLEADRELKTSASPRDVVMSVLIYKLLASNLPAMEGHHD